MRGILEFLFGSAEVNSSAQMFALLGLSFGAVRGFLIARQTLASGTWAATDALANLSFFGTFMAGPVAVPIPFCSRPLDLKSASIGIARIGWGAALLYVAGPWVASLETSGLPSVLEAWANCYRSFVALYFDFAGYTDVAIGAGLLFGVRLPENFRQPLLATSIQNFWQRWHISLSKFISTYAFKPLVRATGRPALAIFVVFIAVGLWHRVDWLYLAWGVGHGAALSAQMLWTRARANRREVLPRMVSRPLGWAVTLSYVSVLSAVANAGGLDHATHLLWTLIGYG